MSNLSRRRLIGTAGATGVASAAALFAPTQGHAAAPPRTGYTPNEPRPIQLPTRPSDDLAILAQDETFWSAVRKNYTITDEITNLEYGYFGIVPNNALDIYLDRAQHISASNSFYMRTEFSADAEVVRARVAEVAGVGVDEIALTRGATEALQLLISNYNDLKPGDEVLYADLDYDSMQYAMNSLRDRRGVKVVTFDIPEPATHEAIMATYRRVLRRHRRAKLLLLTHISHRSGVKMPIAEITELAGRHGVDVIVDAAHSWGQAPFVLPDLKAPFVGLNLHKWMGAPLGVGAMYVRKDRLGDIDRDLADEDYDTDDIRSRVHTGTANSANLLATGAALDFHDRLGADAKQARVQYLRDRWVSGVADLDRITVLTPDDRRMYGSLTSFRLAGLDSTAQVNQLVAWLRDEKRILTVRRGGLANGDAIRVTVAPWTEPDHCDQLVAALHEAVDRF